LPLEIWTKTYDGTWKGTVAEVLLWGTHITMVVAVAFTLVTAVQYVRDAIHLRREQKALAGNA
jgi:CDP-diacylglycerol--glycerol-3-phosphate 3-phosphatidyltransferase